MRVMQNCGVLTCLDMFCFGPQVKWKGKFNILTLNTNTRAPKSQGTSVYVSAQKVMNMLKPSGLKIPGRGPKHSSPVGRSSAGSSSGPAAQKDSKTAVAPINIFLEARYPGQIRYQIKLQIWLLFNW